MTSLITLYFSILLLISGLRTPKVSHRTIQLFRAFFPSWKFYQDIAPLPILFVRLTDSDEKEVSDWKPCLETAPRTRLSLLFNPVGNFHLAIRSLLQQLISEIEEEIEEEIASEMKSAQGLQEKVSYQLVKNLALYQIQHQGHKSLHTASAHHDIHHIHYYQFKIAFVSLGSEKSSAEYEDFLLSPLYPLPPQK